MALELAPGKMIKTTGYNATIPVQCCGCVKEPVNINALTIPAVAAREFGIAAGPGSMADQGGITDLRSASRCRHCW